MKSVQVGPYVVKTLSVGEGLPLLSLAASDDMGKFQTALILGAVSRDNKPISEDDFATLVPHLSAVVSAAMELNGFATKSE